MNLKKYNAKLVSHPLRNALTYAILGEAWILHTTRCVIAKSYLYLAPGVF
jgi:hypothetical protein